MAMIDDYLDDGWVRDRWSWLGKRVFGLDDLYEPAHLDLMNGSLELNFIPKENDTFFMISIAMLISICAACVFSCPHERGGYMGT